VSRFETFLCSPGGRDISARILQHLVKAEGGLQAVLNLRRVCLITKQLVNELPANGGRRIFSNATVRIDLDQEEVVENFLKFPPPIHITSLRLEHVSYITEEKFPALQKFCRFWGRNVRCLRNLEIDCFDLPSEYAERFFHELCIATTFRSFRSLDLMDIEDGTDFPEFIFNMEKLTFDSGIWSGNEVDQERPNGEFYDRLLLPKTLNRLRSFSVDQDNCPIKDIDGVKQLIEAKSNDPGFRLELKFDGNQEQ